MNNKKVDSGKLYGQSDFFKSTPDINLTNLAVLNGGGEESKKLYLFSAPLMDKDSIRKAVLGTLELEKEGEEFSDKQIEIFSQLLEEAKIFHEHVLRMQLPDSLKNFKINSINDLYELIENTFYLNPQNYSTGPIICVLIKIAVAIHYVKKRDFNHLDLNMQYFMGELLKSFDILDEGKDKIRVNIEGEEMGINLTNRSKTFERLVLKILRTPDYDIRQIEDGLGVRIRVEESGNIIQIINHLIRNLFEKNMEVSDLEIQNINLLSSEEVETLQGKLPYVKFNNYINPESASTFQACFVLGYIKVNGSKARIPFEIQFNHEKTDLDEGMAHHKIYELKQLLGSITNIYGYFYEEYLDLMVKNAEIETGINADQIKEYILENSVVEISNRNGEKRFMTNEQAGKLKNRSLIPSSINRILTEDHHLSEEDQIKIATIQELIAGFKRSIQQNFPENGGIISKEVLDVDQTIQILYDLLNKIRRGELNFTQIKGGNFKI
jgi:hypothetical protein